MANSDIKEVVKSKYGEAARRVAAGERGGCGSQASAIPCCDPISSNLYRRGKSREFRNRPLRRRLAVAILRRSRN